MKPVKSRRQGRGAPRPAQAQTANRRLGGGDRRDPPPAWPWHQQGDGRVPASCVAQLVFFRAALARMRRMILPDASWEAGDEWEVRRREGSDGERTAPFSSFSNSETR